LPGGAEGLVLGVEGEDGVGEGGWRGEDGAVELVDGCCACLVWLVLDWEDGEVVGYIAYVEHILREICPAFGVEDIQLCEGVNCRHLWYARFGYNTLGHL